MSNESDIVALGSLDFEEIEPKPSNIEILHLLIDLFVPAQPEA
jgi:hypothetical protein